MAFITGRAFFLALNIVVVRPSATTTFCVTHPLNPPPVRETWFRSHYHKGYLLCSRLNRNADKGDLVLWSLTIDNVIARRATPDVAISHLPSSLRGVAVARFKRQKGL